MQINFSSLNYFVNSSTAPCCVTMEIQKQNEVVRTYILIISGSDGREKKQIDDGEQTAATLDKREEQSTIYMLFSHLKRHFVCWCWSYFRAPGPCREIVQENSHSATTKTNEYHNKASKSTQKRADDDRQHRQTTASNQQSTSFWRYFRS